MRSLKKYITESIHTYNYTVKIAGEVDKNFLDLFIYNLKKFEPVNTPSVSTTPIQKSPYGFPNMSNVSVTILKCEFRYPATEPMIQQCAQACGCNVNRVRVLDTQFADDMEKATDKVQNQYDTSKDKSLLMTTELADDGKEASKEYSQSYLPSIKK